MGRKAQHPFPITARRAQALGQRLKAARLRRRMSEVEMAARVGITRQTLRKLEAGDTSVSLATTLRVLEVLNLDHQISEVAAIDPLGTTLTEGQVPGPRRRTRSPLADDL